jgi:phosphopantothenate synthetase
LGQPEEIAAHAQEFVAGILNQISKLPKDNQLTQIDKVLRSVHEISNYSMMKDQDNPSYKKVLNRYLKSVYQEFDSYRDSLELP